MVSGGALTWVGLRWSVWRDDRVRIEIMQMYRAYAHYVLDHSGELPGSFSDLVGNRYLRLTDREGEYLAPAQRDFEFIPVYDTIRFRAPEGMQLRYGGNLSDFEERDGRIYERYTQKEVLLLEPSRSRFVELAREYKLKIFRRLSAKLTTSAIEHEEQPFTP